MLCTDRHTLSPHVSGVKKLVTSGNNNRPHTNGLTTLSSAIWVAKWQRFGNNSRLSATVINILSEKIRAI